MSLYQKKSLSQVFLKENWPVERMIAHVREKHVTRILEVGPGAGVLTRPALEAGLVVTAVEKDTRFADKLAEMFASHKSMLTIVNADILKFNLSSWLAESDEPTMVIGNIPYHISTPILEWVLPHLDKIQGAMFLVQVEFARRISAPHGNKDYGSISVFTQLRARPKLLFEVPRTCFKPVPKVDSAVLELTDLAEKTDPALLKRSEEICRRAFTQRRKKLSNCIAPFLENVNVENFPIDLNLRPEQLSPQDFLTLAATLKST